MAKKRKVAPKRKDGRGHRGAPVLDPLKVAAALSALDGNLSAVARKFGVTRGAVQALVRQSDTLKEVLSDAREGMVDEAENGLLSAVRDREAWAICFTLKTQGKARGYVERQELDTRNATRLVIDEEVVGGTGDHSQDGEAPPAAGGVPA